MERPWHHPEPRLFGINFHPGPQGPTVGICKRAMKKIQGSEFGSGFMNIV
jgi:hypothetical protein